MNSLHLLPKLHKFFRADWEASQKLSDNSYSFLNVLNIGINENSHTRIIASLLDPEGSHGCRDKLLQLFYKRAFDDNSTKLLPSTRVFIEKDLGYIDYTGQPTGGRVDIYIDSDPIVLLENKIDAYDQKDQLVRYLNSVKGSKVIYLTLDGRKPSEYIGLVKEIQDRIVCISYQKVIIPWLTECIEFANKNGDASLSLCLVQYRSLVYTIIKSRLGMFTENLTEGIKSYFSKPEVLFGFSELDALIQYTRQYRANLAIELFQRVEECLRNKGILMSSSIPSECLGENDNQLMHFLPKGWEKFGIAIGFEGYKHHTFRADMPCNDMFISLYTERYSEDWVLSLFGLDLFKELFPGWTKAENGRLLCWKYYPWTVNSVDQISLSNLDMLAAVIAEGILDCFYKLDGFNKMLSSLS